MLLACYLAQRLKQGHSPNASPVSVALGSSFSVPLVDRLFNREYRIQILSELYSFLEQRLKLSYISADALFNNLSNIEGKSVAEYYFKLTVWYLVGYATNRRAPLQVSFILFV